jgi:hypothetical protein
LCFQRFKFQISVCGSDSIFVLKDIGSVRKKYQTKTRL